jgi:hypothetical protein
MLELVFRAARGALASHSSSDAPVRRRVASNRKSAVVAGEAATAICRRRGRQRSE